MNNKDLIKQYVNTGLRIDDYQINRLSPNDLKSYLRVRLIAGKLNSTEFNKLDDSDKEKYIKGIDKFDLESEIDNIAYKNPNDIFLNSVIKYRNSTDIKNNLTSLIVYANSKPQIINTIVDKVGSVFSGNRDITNLFYHLTDEQQLGLGIKLMDKNLEYIEGGFTSDNSPMLEIIGNLNNQPLFFKYIIDTNVKRNGGEKIKLDGDTYFGLLQNTDDKYLGLLIRYMEKFVDLTPNQEKYNSELKDELKKAYGS